MARVNVGFKYQSFRYDFAVNGGAISSIGMGIFLPDCQVMGIMLIPETPLASGGAAVVDVGAVGALNDIIDNANMGVAGDFNDYNGAGFNTTLENAGFFGSLIPPATGDQIISAGQVMVTISAFALTAGKFVGTIFYIEFP